MSLTEAAHRRLLERAIGALKENRADLELDFPGALAKAIAEDARPGPVKKSGSAAASFSSLSFDALELMGDDQVQEAVDRARLQQVIRLACEAGLAVFSARLSSAQGFAVVKADKNPLRPEIVSQVLFKLVQGLPVASQVRTRWLSDGAQLMGDELQSLYVLLDNLLAGQGIAAAAYGVIASPESRSARAEPENAGALESNSSASPINSERGRPVADLETTQTWRNSLLTIDHLHHLLVGDYDSSFKGRALPSGYELEEIVHKEFAHTIPAALDVLVDLEEKGLVRTDAGKARPDTPRTLAQMRAHLKTDAKSLGQSLAIEVVGLMIDQLARDSRLLMPVRQVIANAEPAFLRLAVTDPRFFSNKSHPARRLLEVITSTSLAYANENATGFAAFMQNLQEVAVLLTEEHASDAQHFATLLKDFERRQAGHTREHRESQSRAVRALLQAEQRNLLAEKIAAEIRMRSDFVGGYRIITAFLTGPWAQVMAKERLLGEHGGTGSTEAVFSHTLGDVLWSLDTVNTSSHRKRLLRIIPDMLKSLRAGLLSIDYPLEKSRPFFDELMAIHRAGLQAPPESTSPAGTSRDGFEKMFVTGEDFSVSQPWLAPAEARNSGFMEDWEPPAQHAPEPDRPASQNDAALTGTAQPGAVENPTLHLGDWVELLMDLQWLRAQLTWISPHNTLYMFTSDGGRKHSMSSRVLQHLLELNLVKVVSQQGVLDGALDSVARTAMRNSLEGGGNF